MEQSDIREFVQAIAQERSSGEEEAAVWRTILERIDESLLEEIRAFLMQELECMQSIETLEVSAYVAQRRALSATLRALLLKIATIDPFLRGAIESLPEMQTGSFSDEQLRDMCATEDTMAAFLASLDTVQFQDMIDVLSSRSGIDAEAVVQRDYLIALLESMRDETFRDLKRMKELLTPFGREQGELSLLQSQIVQLESIASSL